MLTIPHYFSKKEESSVSNAMELLERFCSASGLLFNWSKFVMSQKQKKIVMKAASGNKNLLENVERSITSFTKFKKNF
jgi:hypothetical protein